MFLKKKRLGRLWFPIKKKEEEHVIKVFESSRLRRRVRPNRKIGKIFITTILLIYVINKYHMKILN